MKKYHEFSTIDTHTGGEPTRTIIDGLPSMPGKSIEDKRLYIKENLDWIRTSLILEPRGHSSMSGIILTEPTAPQADVGIIFIETGEHPYPAMCGHGTIGVVTALVEAGLINVKEPVTEIKLDTPEGLVKVLVDVENGSAKNVTFRNIPSFVFANNVQIDIPDHGLQEVDVAYGGNVFAIIPARALRVKICPENADEIIGKGRAVRDAVNARVKIKHPLKKHTQSCTHVQFYEKSPNEGIHFKNVVFYSQRALDRSPCGTGTAARVAALYSAKKLSLNEEFCQEGIIGSIFKAKAIEECKVGRYAAVIVEITGRAYITGTHKFIIDPNDPHGKGFTIG